MKFNFTETEVIEPTKTFFPTKNIGLVGANKLTFLRKLFKLMKIKYLGVSFIYVEKVKNHGIINV